ncbi:uncharacterized protein LOC107767711 [Nicotiana tabacum]|uniref:Uncharacterized protein LOC107767711 n=1 Tax=Nicotiana tabacum TaxID=4097 RepID=A0AC58SM45_TOBAC
MEKEQEEEEKELIHFIKFKPKLGFDVRVVASASRRILVNFFTCRPASSRFAFHEDDYTHPCHPLYVHPSDVLGASLASVPFDGTGYGSWRRTILVALSVRNKLDFVNGVSDIARSVEYSELAKDIWGKLEQRYGQANAARIFELKKELAHISQRSLDIASYFNKIKQLWDEIAALSVTRVRTCSNYGAKSDYQKDEDVQKVYQFLMGLNDTYIQTRSNIFMIKPFPSVSTVYSILLSDEKQRQVSTSPQFLPSSASFNAGVSKQVYPSRVNFDSSKSAICKYCKKSGHTIDKYYKLHGYPPNFKFTKGPPLRKTAAHVELEQDSSSNAVVPGGRSQSDISSESVFDSMVPGLTKDQYSQLMMLLQHTHIFDLSSTPNIMASANFAGKLISESVLLKSCMLSQVDSFIWIIYSGASDHMTSHKDLLFNLQPLPIPCLVSLPNGYKVKVHLVGSLTLFPNFIIHHVLYVPSFQYNLISVHKLLDQFNRIVLFTITLCAIQALSPKMPLVFGKLDHNLYKLILPPVASNTSVNSSVIPTSFVASSLMPDVCVFSSEISANVTSACSNKRHVHADANMNSFNKMDVVWHYRLGHIPFSRMKHIPALALYFSPKQSFSCPVCPLARQTRLPFPDSSIQTTKPFQLIYIDTWGPYNSPTYNGSKYFLTIVDDFSRATWTHLMGAKSNAFDLLKAFIAMTEIHFQLKVQTVRSNNALELGSSTVGSAYFSEKGIIHQTLCPHTPQQNGVVERKHRHLLETARALLFQSGLPIRFWGDCILTATYLINRFPSSLLKDKSSYEILYNKLPVYSNLRAFGCLCYSTVPKPHRDKLQPRATPCVFLGYPFAKKGYKLYDLKHHTCFVSRDVTFHEHIFPFIQTTSKHSPLCNMPLSACFNHSHQSDLSEPTPLYHPSPSLPTTSFPIDSSPIVFTINPLPSLSPSLPPETISFSISSETVSVVRRSSRPHNPPSYLQNYVCHLTSQSLKFANSTSVSALDKHNNFEPNIYSQAVSNLE